ncbi:hypothetical protein ABKA04_005118 [Annulohypoxylon sp. FPYF3050]
MMPNNGRISWMLTQLGDAVYGPAHGTNPSHAHHQFQQAGDNQDIPHNTVYPPGDFSQAAPGNAIFYHPITLNQQHSAGYIPAASDMMTIALPRPNQSYPTQSTAVNDPDRRYYCALCNWKHSYVHRKDLYRHFKTHHAAKGDLAYICACGKVGRRKDNHSRHVKSCRDVNRNRLYKCGVCGKGHPDKTGHLKHIKHCKPRRVSHLTSTQG